LRAMNPGMALRTPYLRACRMEQAAWREAQSQVAGRVERRLWHSSKHHWHPDQHNIGACCSSNSNWYVVLLQPHLIVCCADHPQASHCHGLVLEAWLIQLLHTAAATAATLTLINRAAGWGSSTCQAGWQPYPDMAITGWLLVMLQQYPMISPDSCARISRVQIGCLANDGSLHLA